MINRAAFFAWNIHAGELGQLFNGFGEVKAIIFHQKAKRIAAGTTAETVVELLVGADRK